MSLTKRLRLAVGSSLLAASCITTQANCPSPEYIEIKITDEGALTENGDGRYWTIYEGMTTKREGYIRRVLIQAYGPEQQMVRFRERVDGGTIVYVPNPLAEKPYLERKSQDFYQLPIESIILK